MAAFVSLRHFTLSGRQVTLSGRQLQKAPWNLSQVKLEFHLPNSVGDGSDSSGSRDTKEGEVDVALDQAESDSNHTESGLHVIVNIDRSTFRYSCKFDFMDLKDIRLHRSTSEVQVGIDKSTFLYSSTGKYAFIDSDLLESLRPHGDLKEVCIKKFNGTEFPGWLVDRSYHNIERVELVDCWISSGLMPALGGLPSLKCLLLEGVRNVKKLGSELYISTVPFGSLEELRFEHMKEWEEWKPSDDAAAGGGICFFPRLQKLSIVDCPKLKGRLPSNLPSLKTLRIDSCSSLVELNGCHRHRQVVHLVIECDLANSCLVDMRLGMFPYLESLAIGDCGSFECFPTDDSLPTSLTYLGIRGFTRLKKLDVFCLQSLTNLERLVIKDCPLLESLGYSSDVDDEFPFNSSLKKLDVLDCGNLKTINGAWLRSFTSLQQLTIHRCDKLEALPEGGLPRSLIELTLWGIKIIRRQDWIAIQNLTSLEILEIKDCNQLKVLPVKLPCSLKKLRLYENHPDLLERCKRDTGPDWPNIAHVPDIHIWNMWYPDILIF